jgi:hypothetical protein
LVGWLLVMVKRVSRFGDIWSLQGERKWKGRNGFLKIFQNVGEKKIGIKRDKQNILRQKKQIPLR